MDNTNIRYDAIRKVLKTVPMGYDGVKVVFSHISTDTYESKNIHTMRNPSVPLSRANASMTLFRNPTNPRAGKSDYTFIDCYYVVTIEDTKKPFITIRVLDDISEKLIKWGKLIYGSGNKVRLNPKLILKRNGYEDVQVPPPDSSQNHETPLDIIIGTDNEKILENFSGQGQMESAWGRIEYWIDKYGKALSRRNNRVSRDEWSYVEDSKLFLSVDLYIPELEFVSYVQDSNYLDIAYGAETSTENLEATKNELILQYVKEIRENTNVSDSFNTMEDLIPSIKSLGGMIPSNTPLKLKNLSPLSQQLLEIAIYFYGDESYSLDDVLPGLSIVSDVMSRELEDIDDAYVRVQTNVFYKNKNIKNDLDYYPDSTSEAEDSLLMSLMVDWIYENN